jgi:hypothetical protein
MLGPVGAVAHPAAREPTIRIVVALLVTVRETFM